MPSAMRYQESVMTQPNTIAAVGLSVINVLVHGPIDVAKEMHPKKQARSLVAVRMVMPQVEKFAPQVNANDAGAANPVMN